MLFRSMGLQRGTHLSERSAKSGKGAVLKMTWKKGDPCREILWHSVEFCEPALESAARAGPGAEG